MHLIYMIHQIRGDLSVT